MKSLHTDEFGEIQIRKSRRAKRLIMKIVQTGQPVVTLPYYAPYYVAESFIKSNVQWLRKNLPSNQSVILTEGAKIGSSHILTFKATTDAKITARVGKDTVVISHPNEIESSDAAVQREAKKGAIRALRRQAEAQLPSLLHKLAALHGYAYREVRIKATRTRWGSCSSNKVINLSAWLMQLPDSLIEYVLCHELAHLEHLNHSHDFWQAVEAMVPDYKQRRKALKSYSPSLQIA